MKKIIIPLLVVAMVMSLISVGAMYTSAENANEPESSIPDDTLITYGYLKAFKEQIKQEVIAELMADGGISIETPYNDISATEGQLILLYPESEVIYRGGGAVAVTSSDNEGEGITDMSNGVEIFSGQSLEYGHIYYSSATDSKKAILVTGATAYFTVRGDYEIG